MIILKGAFAITLHRVIETILSIILFRTIFHWVKVITGLWGLYSFFIAIFINIKTRKFIISKYKFYKKKFFPKYVDTFEFDSKLLVGHDLNKIVSSNAPITNTKGVSLTLEEVQSIRADFIQLKNEMGNHLFEFIFKSATQSSLINLFTMMFSEYLKNNYGISILTSLTICISLSFIISFVSSLNYTKMLLKEWNQLIDNIEKTSNNRRLILYVYGNPKPPQETTLKESTDVAEQPSVHQRKGDKKSKSKQQKQEKPVEKVVKKRNPDHFIVGVVSNEIENSEHLKIKLMLLNPKFTENASDISENFVTKFIPQVLITSPTASPQGGGLKNMMSTIGGMMQNFFLMSQLNTVATDDPFFSTNTLKECTVYVTDYYDVASKLSNYLKTKGFKLHEKWAEYNMFLFIKFKVYEYRKNFANIGNRNQQSSTPQINLGNLFSSLNSTQGQNLVSTNAQPKINLNNLFNAPNTASSLHSSSQNAQPPINIFESLRALNAQKNNSIPSNIDSNAAASTTVTPRPAINLLDSLKSLNLQNNPNNGLLQQILNNLAQQNAQKVQNNDEKQKTT